MGEVRPLFVYGTLKRGLPNHVHLPACLSFLSPARTVAALPLVVGPKGIPFLLLLPGRAGALRVSGELYAVPDSALGVLDAFEGVESGFYERVVVDVEVESEGITAAWTYVRHPEGGGPVWAREWTVEKLAEEACVGDYTRELAAVFVPRGKRGGK